MFSTRVVPRVAFLALAIAAVLPAGAASLSADLEEALLYAGPDDLVPVVVMMEAFPARGELLAEVRGMSRESRRAHVVDRMKSLAESSQRPVHLALVGLDGEIRNLRVLWGVNGVAVEATPRVIERLAAIPEVLRVSYDGGSGRPADGEDATGPTGGDTSGPNPDAEIVGEVTAMGAPRVWDELGYTGAGVIVAVIDTGVDPTHPDLADHIWTNLDEVGGNAIDDDGNGYIDDTWGFDLCGRDPVPDSGTHGTQVAGQVAGDGTDGTVTGMAPDAELMVIGVNCSPSDSIGWEASQYAVDNGAHIITESYVWPWAEDTPDFEGWRRQSDTELAAGVIHINAAGNDGDDPTHAIPYNVHAPANVPPPWLHPDQTLVGGVSSVVTVGNVGWPGDLIMSHSSRGPSAWEDIVANTDPDYPWTLTPGYMDYPYENGAEIGLLKPDISAYGNGTTATCPGPYYCSFSGTSSATPHVTGVVALMMQANPESTPAELTEALLSSAEHRGDPGKNNVYGAGMLRAYEAVTAVESSVVYSSHAFDDVADGNGDLALDPGERVTMRITVESRTDVPIDGVVAILSTPTPGVTVHEQIATYPTVPAGGTAESEAPHFTLSVDPAECGTIIAFDLEVRYGGTSRLSTFLVRVGDLTTGTLLTDDFESDLGWTSDPGTTTTGEFVREDPIGVMDDLSRLANPEDDSTVSGTHCWVTGNGVIGGKNDENNNDVDDGGVILLSPPFGEPTMLALDLSYDRWYYDVDAGNTFVSEVSNDGGQTWTLIESRPWGEGGWDTHAVDLFALIPPTDDMRLRFVITDSGTDDPVEGAIDEVIIDGTWIECEAYAPAAALPPNPVGDTLFVDVAPGGHARLTWQAPPVDGGHDAATLYRVERATSPAGPYAEAGSSTDTSWTDVDALRASESFYYRVLAENAGGSE